MWERGLRDAEFKEGNQPLVNFFGEKPHLLVTAGTRLGGWSVPYGDAAIEIMALPRLPLVFVIWAGDEEFPPDAGVLYDVTAGQQLSTEDCVVLAQMGVMALKEAAK